MNEEKNYWCDWAMMAKRAAYMSGNVRIPKNLRGKIEFHVKDNGELVIRSKK